MSVDYNWGYMSVEQNWYYRFTRIELVVRLAAHLVVAMVDAF